MDFFVSSAVDGARSLSPLSRRVFLLITKPGDAVLNRSGQVQGSKICLESGPDGRRKKMEWGWIDSSLGVFG